MVTTLGYAGVLMKTLHKYVLKEQIPPFLFGMFVVIFILILNFLYKNLETLIGKGVPITTSIELLVLSLGWMVVMAVPMAVLIAVLISFMRLGSDNEIVAMRTAGLSLTQIAKPLIIASFALSLAMIPVHNYVVPETNHRLANLLIAIHKKKPALQLRDGIFMNDIKGYSILVQKARGRKIEGVTISKLVEGKPAQTIRADHGEIYYAADGTTLVIKLYDGEIHDVDPKDPRRYLRVKFTEHTLNIPEAGSKLVKVDRKYRGDRELSIGGLMHEIEKYKTKLYAVEDEVASTVSESVTEAAAIRDRLVTSDSLGVATGSLASTLEHATDRLKTLRDQANSYRRKIRSLSVEVHKKIAISFACVVFVLLGVPIAVRAKEGGAGAGMVISSGFFAIYYAFLTAGEKLADRGYVLPSLSMWAANIVLGAVGIYLFIRANKELPFVPARLTKWLRSLLK